MANDEAVRVCVELVLKPENRDAFVRALAEMIADSIRRDLMHLAPKPEERLLSIKETSVRLGVCERTLRRWIARGSIRCVPVGKLVKFASSEVQQVAEKGTRPWLEDGILRRKR